MIHSTRRCTRRCAVSVLALSALLLTVMGAAEAMLPAPHGVHHHPAHPRTTTILVPIDGRITAGQWILFAVSIVAALAVGAALMQATRIHRHRLV